ncbi:MFS transporter [Luteipulveratus mongoliensis]|uniref:Puromycin resistance protein pur8 n=1 Tax=Luteipulveratus mongoliensis TaxID=571913 RepID=A0A0K1JLY8_9MICO|nr:MFS transporter [Luteipulveratus mongoliensis]AKU17722.1 Puromycin resistance protein pur8 [Luteipulveratus mongoliensis]
MQTQTRPAEAPAVRDHRWTALVVIAVAQLMVALDATVVNIALPTAQHALGFSDGDRAWVVTAYTTAVAGLLLLGGRVADRFGRRRAFLVGLAGFAVASALAGAATNLGLLMAGRALQGVFAAVLAPTALSLIAVTFTDGKERAKAFGVYGAVASSGAAVGLLLGGVLTEYAGWRWCLYINVAIALVAFVVGRRVLPSGDGFPESRIDVPAGLLVTAGIAAIVYACAQAASEGWTSREVIVPFLIGVLGVAGFVVHQRRSAAPVLPLWVLADRSRIGAYLAVAAAVVGSFGMFLMLTYHFQGVLGWSPIRTGLAFLPLSVAVSVGSFGLGSKLLPKVAPRALIVPGLVVAASGLLLLSGMTVDSGYLTRILPAEVLLGVGMGCVFTPAISVATSGIDRRFAGVAAATANTFMQVGGSIGTAALNSVAVAATASAGAGATALVHGFAVATTWAAVLLLAAAVAAAVLVRTPRPDPQQH